MEDISQIHASVALPSLKQPPVHRGGGRVDSRTVLEASE